MASPATQLRSPLFPAFPWYLSARGGPVRREAARRYPENLGPWFFDARQAKLFFLLSSLPGIGLTLDSRISRTLRVDLERTWFTLKWAVIVMDEGKSTKPQHLTSC